jgi:hypothetical protein
MLILTVVMLTRVLMLEKVLALVMGQIVRVVVRV